MELSVSFLKEGSYKDHINKINNSNADYIHFDVMDGKFVEEKNLTVSELEKYLSMSQKKNDVHLMVKDPSKYISAMALYDVNNITIHKEIKNFDEMIEKIKSYGHRVGVAIKPDTSIEEIFPYLDRIDLVLIMSVYPGKSGQSFIEESISKLKTLKEEIDKKGLHTKIEIDGGINEDNIYLLGDADIIVSATYLLNNLEEIDKIKSAFN